MCEPHRGDSCRQERAAPVDAASRRSPGRTAPPLCAHALRPSHRHRLHCFPTACPPRSTGTCTVTEEAPALSVVRREAAGAVRGGGAGALRGRGSAGGVRRRVAGRGRIAAGAWQRRSRRQHRASTAHKAAGATAGGQAHLRGEGRQRAVRCPSRRRPALARSGRGWRRRGGGGRRACRGRRGRRDRGGRSLRPRSSSPPAQPAATPAGCRAPGCCSVHRCPPPPLPRPRASARPPLRPPAERSDCTLATAPPDTRCQCRALHATLAGRRDLARHGAVHSRWHRLDVSRQVFAWALAAGAHALDAARRGVAEGSSWRRVGVGVVDGSGRRELARARELAGLVDGLQLTPSVAARRG
eukprot:490097-Rhodomonas_salina.5